MTFLFIIRLTTPMNSLCCSPSQCRKSYSPLNHPTFPLWQDGGCSSTKATPFKNSSRTVSQFISSFVRAAQARPLSYRCFGKFYQSSWLLSFNETTRDFFKMTNPEEELQRKKLFKNLVIAKDKGFEAAFGKYPVMYLDFSVCDSALVALSMLISDGCRRCLVIPWRSCCKPSRHISLPWYGN